MILYSEWHFDGVFPAPEGMGYRPLHLVKETPDLSVVSHAAMLAAKAATVPHDAPLVANCEKYRNNVGAVCYLSGSLTTLNVGNPFGSYCTEANGDRWGICGQRSASENAIAVDRSMTAIDRLSLFVDFHCVDLFRSDMNQGTGDTPMVFPRMTADETWRLIAQTRVSMLAHTRKPWWGFIGVKAIPAIDKAVGSDLSADLLYGDALWCKNHGAAGLVVMVWDDARKKAAGTGAVRVSPEITKALINIGKL